MAFPHPGKILPDHLTFFLPPPAHDIVTTYDLNVGSPRAPVTACCFNSRPGPCLGSPTALLQPLPFHGLVIRLPVTAALAQAVLPHRPGRGKHLERSSRQSKRSLCSCERCYLVSDWRPLETQRDALALMHVRYRSRQKLA